MYVGMIEFRQLCLWNWFLIQFARKLAISRGLISIFYIPINYFGAAVSAAAFWSNTFRY